MRVTPQMVAAAYGKTKLLSTRGSFFIDLDGIHYACGLGALLIANGIHPKPNPDDDRTSENDPWYEAARRLLDMPSSYVEGFTEGFDGIQYRLNRQNRYLPNDRYADGYADGRDAARLNLKEDAPQD